MKFEFRPDFVFVQAVLLPVFVNIIDNFYSRINCIFGSSSQHSYESWRI